MIKTFRHKGLSEHWNAGKSAKIAPALRTRIDVRLRALDSAAKPEDMNAPGFDFHALRGTMPTRYTVHVNGPWCITFEWDGTDAVRVDLEQYH